MRDGIVAVEEDPYSLRCANAVHFTGKERIEDVTWLIYHAQVRRVAGLALTVSWGQDCDERRRVIKVEAPALLCCVLWNIARPGFGIEPA